MLIIILINCSVMYMHITQRTSYTIHTVCLLLKVTRDMSVQWLRFEMGFSWVAREYRNTRFLTIFNFLAFLLCACALQLTFF